MLSVGGMIRACGVPRVRECHLLGDCSVLWACHVYGGCYGFERFMVEGMSRLGELSRVGEID